MTAKELRKYEEGKACGRRHPSKTLGWTKSEAWNAGMAAGQKEYWKEWKKKQARIRAYWRIQRQAEKAGEGLVSPEEAGRGMGGAGKND